MAKRKRSPLQRLFNKALGREPTKAKPFKLPPSKPTPKAPTPSRRSYRRQAVQRILDVSPFANATRVRRNVDQMDADEMRWTANATPDQIRWRARQDADRMLRIDDTGDFIPLNPWWYH